MLLLLLACTAERPDSSAPIDSGDTAPLPPGTVEVGAACPLTDRIGEVALISFGGAEVYLQGQVFDRPDPWVGPPARSTDTCDFHQFALDSCGGCDAGQVCAYDGSCVAERRAVPVTAVVTHGGASDTYASDATTNTLYGEVGTRDGAYALSLTIAGQTVDIPEARVVGAPDGLVVQGEGDYYAPRSLTAAWTPTTGRVRTHISINHHAAGPTFTHCDVPGETATFTADEDMLAPLAVVTGLEFQGVEAANTAAAHMDAGCVDVRLGSATSTQIAWTAR